MMKNREEMQSIHVSVLLLLLEENLSFLWNIWISKYLDKGPGLGGFIYQVLYSLWAHTSCWECLLPTSDSTLVTVKKIKKGYCKRNAGRFFCPCCINVISLWTLGHFPPFVTQNNLFWREKEPHAIGLRFGHRLSDHYYLLLLLSVWI